MKPTFFQGVQLRANPCCIDVPAGRRPTPSRAARGLVLGSALSVALLGGCASGPFGAPSQPGARAGAPASYVTGFGVVESVDVVSGRDPSLLGALIGGVAGGVLGTQVGGGRGQTIATIAGALGGAYAGGAYAGGDMRHPFSNRDRVAKVTIHMDSGARQTIAMESRPNLQAGDRVVINREGQVLRSDQS